MERLSTIFVALCISQALATSPLLIWNSNEAPGKIPAISALQNVSYSSLWKDYLQAFPSDNIILFMQDALSIEDLTSFPHENAELSKLVSDSHSVYLPSVEETASLPRDFRNEGYNVVEVSKLQSGLNLKSDKNVVLVNLPDTLTIPEAQRKLAMQKTNEVIESVLSKVGDLRNFTSIFTARKSSKESGEVTSRNKRRVTRSLQQDNGRPAGFHNHTCALIYLRNDIELKVKNANGSVTTIVIPNSKSIADADTGHCADEKSSVQITYRDVENIPGAKSLADVRLEFVFEFSKSKWQLSHVEGNLDTRLSRDFVFKMNKRENELVPGAMSYSCSVKRVLSTSNKTKDDQTMTMILNGFQYEAYRTQLNRNKFDGAWDCVGFFTVPVWMSLITVLIFLIILFWGLWMLSDVKTMDRFDDPKGKSIVVPNTD